MMSVLVENPEGKAILLTKGAPEEIFHQCSQFELDGKLSPMDPALMKRLKDQYASLSNDGFRVLAVAVKELAVFLFACRDVSRRGLRRNRAKGLVFLIHETGFPLLPSRASSH